MDIETAQVLVLDVLHRASSQDPAILKPAESKLMEWETEAGFYTILNNIISNHALDVTVRWIGVLYMKNGIDKYWRKNVPNAISESEKVNIRLTLLTNFNEPINQIAVQRAVLISKVARIDYPKEWPNLFPMLLRAIANNDAFIQQRALLTLHHVVKAIASKRLAGDRKQFQEFTSQVFMYVLNLWNELTTSFIQGIMQNEAVNVVNMNLEKALLALRILRKLSVFGFLKPHFNKDCMTFMEMIFDKTKNVLICYKEMKSKGTYPTDVCEKFVIHLTKILLSMLDTHPYSYIDLIKPTLDLCLYYLFTDEGITFLFERFVIQCFNLIKSILLCTEYRVAKNPEHRKNDDKLRAHMIIQSCFTPEIVTDVCRKLIGHYFILTQDELEMWDADPESFSNDECGDSWKYSLRPSMDTVFITIFHEYKDVLTPVVLEMINTSNVIVPPDDMSQILKKDAIYNAAGLCAFDLFDEVDFDQWFSNTLVQELRIRHNNYRVIRRRVTALIGRWTGIKLSSEFRPVLYECIVGLLGSDEDMVVRLTAASTLRYAIDDFEFNCDQFKDYMFTAFNLLFELLKEAGECETKMQVLNVMTLLLERMGNTIVPHSEALVQYLPHLWNESEDHYMLRCAIVATLVQLVKSMGGVPQELSPFLLPIIQMGTDVNQGAIVYLLEDALDLWAAVLEYSPAMTNEFMQLFNNMPPLLDYSTENLRSCLYICLVHLLLAPELVMHTQGNQIITICDSLMSDLKNEGVVMLMRLIDTFIRALPVLGSETVMPILPRIFKRIYDKDDYPLIMSMFLCILSRVLLSSHEVFTRILSNLSQELSESDETTLGKILDSWLHSMPNVSQVDQRKLLGLALTNLLTTQSPTVLHRFNPIMTQILEALNDITKSDDDGVMTDSLVLAEGQSPSYFNEDGGYYETDHDQRKKQLILSDPVHTIVLKDYLQSQIVELRKQVGPQYEQLLNTLDADVISQLKGYISF
ncbi:importin beta11 [Rhynchophorus ferrugineus]|uniref:importin beta11 n=1 Tax=Rhynchophorus ferrugineus TaxID=354439 RepID=UPI003FCD0F5D